MTITSTIYRDVPESGQELELEVTVELSYTPEERDTGVQEGFDIETVWDSTGHKVTLTKEEEQRIIIEAFKQMKECDI